MAAGGRSTMTVPILSNAVKVPYYAPSNHCPNTTIIPYTSNIPQNDVGTSAGQLIAAWGFLTKLGGMTAQLMGLVAECRVLL